MFLINFRAQAIAFCFCALATSAMAQTYFACVNSSSGRIRITPSEGLCKKREYPMSWNSQGPQGVQGEPGPAGPMGPQGEPGTPLIGLVRVVDANGKIVGHPLIDNYVVMKYGDYVFVNKMSGGNFSSGRIYFKDSDCSGTPYVDSGSTWGPNGFNIVEAPMIQNTLYIGDLTLAESISYNSYYDGSCTPALGQIPIGTPIALLVVATEEFQRPFTFDW